MLRARPAAAQRTPHDNGLGAPLGNEAHVEAEAHVQQIHAAAGGVARGQEAGIPSRPCRPTLRLAASSRQRQSRPCRKHARQQPPWPAHLPTQSHTPRKL